MFDQLNTPIIDFDILKTIKQLKIGRSGGPDALLNEFLYTVNTFFCHF
jgi:hypothetical protein